MKTWLWVGVLAVMANAAIAGEKPSSFQIVSEDGAGDARRVSVRLDGRVSEAELQAIADAVKARQAPGKSVAAVAFFLPSMALSNGPWAEVRLQPEIKVIITGIRRDEEDVYRAEAQADTRAVIGVWVTSAPAVPGRLTIWRDKDSRIFAEWRLRSGQKTIDELVEQRARNGRRFDIKGSGGGYYLAAWNGTLELGEKSSVIAVSERLQFEKPKAEKAQNQEDVAAPAQRPATAPSRSEQGPGGAGGPSATAAGTIAGGTQPASQAAPSAGTRKYSGRRGREALKSRADADGSVSDTVSRALTR